MVDLGSISVPVAMRVLPWSNMKLTDLTKKVCQPWNDEEMKVIEQVISGEFLKYQAAIKLGRSIKSVRRRIERLNEERNAQLETVNQ